VTINTTGNWPDQMVPRPAMMIVLWRQEFDRSSERRSIWRAKLEKIQWQGEL
jgi:hypothetical protein